MPPAPHARHVALPSLITATLSPKAAASKHGRNRSSSGSSTGSSSGSRSLPPLPTLSTASDGVLEQDASEILWKTFVAYEQDCREAPNLLPLMAGIETTVAAAVDPISAAGLALKQCALYIQTEFRQDIEQALAGPGAGLAASASCEGPKTSTASHSKQLTLASTRLSSSCSTFRATQTSLRYYGGARKTAYQLDLFIHKYALPTSTALHKRGQEYSAATKWLKKALHDNDRMLDALEMAALRRASNQLMKWAASMEAHAEVMKKAASDICGLMTERASLQAYAFPSRSALAMEPAPAQPIPMAQSPLSTYTDFSSLFSPQLSSSPLSSVASALPQQSVHAFTTSPQAQHVQPSKQNPFAMPESAHSAQTYTFFDPATSMNAPLSSIMPQSCSLTFANAQGIDLSYQQPNLQSPFVFSSSVPSSEYSLLNDFMFEGITF